MHALAFYAQIYLAASPHAPATKFFFVTNIFVTFLAFTIRPRSGNQIPGRGSSTDACETFGNYSET